MATPALTLSPRPLLLESSGLRTYLGPAGGHRRHLDFRGLCRGAGFTIRELGFAPAPGTNLRLGDTPARGWLTVRLVD